MNTNPKSLKQWAELSLGRLLEQCASIRLPTSSNAVVEYAHEESCASSQGEEYECDCDVVLTVCLNPFTVITVRAPRTKDDLSRQEVLEHLTKTSKKAEELLASKLKEVLEEVKLDEEFAH